MLHWLQCTMSSAVLYALLHYLKENLLTFWHLHHFPAVRLLHDCSTVLLRVVFVHKPCPSCAPTRSSQVQEIWWSCRPDLMDQTRTRYKGLVFAIGGSKHVGSYKLIMYTYCRTYLLTPWSRALEKLTGSQLVKKFPTFYGTRTFITTFTSAHHLFLS